MTELGPDARELVDAGRAAFKPTAADRERVLRALLPLLEPPIVPGAESSAVGLTSSALGKMSLALVAIGATAGLMLALRSQPEQAPAPPASPSAVPPAQTVALAPSAAPIGGPDDVEAVDAPVVRTQQSKDRLAEEVAILSRAGTALRNGSPAVALKALAEHQQRFPKGALAQERSAARVQALCALGRVDEGLSELKRLERAAPRSPHLARARKACGLDRASPH